MNRKFFLPAALAAVVAACPQAGFAARQAAVGPGVVALNASGITDGVDLSGNATLNVGTVGGPRTNIFTNNNPLGTVGGLAVSTDASSQGSIVFNSSSTVFGNIGITQPGGPFLLNIFAGEDGEDVTFLGSVYATTLNVNGTGAVNFNSGLTNVTATNFASDGTISLAPNTTVIGALTSTAGANTGTLLLGGGSILDGAVGGASGLKTINVVGGNNNAGVSATITGATDAFAFSLGTNTLNIGGALTIANNGPGGVINTTLASSTVFGHITPVGAANFGNLTINVLVPSTAYIPVGTQFNIINATSGTSGSILTVLVQNPTNPLYTFAPVPLAGTLNGMATIQAMTIPLQVAPSPVVPVLIATPQTADLDEVLAAINAFTDPNDVINAVAQLSPSTPDLAAPQVTFQATRQFQGLWMSRLDTVLCNPVKRDDKEQSNCDGNEQKSGWWLKGFGDFGTQGARSDTMGYNSRTLGTMIAYDAPVADTLPGKTRAGLGVGYARSNINGKTFDNDTDFDSYQTTAYIGHERGPWFVYGNASLGLNDYSGKRHIAFTGVDRTAHSDYNGQDYTAFANTGYHFSANEFTITPLASLQYTRLNMSGYTETGAGDIDLRVKSRSYDFVESGLGVKVERAFSYKGATYVPEMHSKWLHDLSNPSSDATAAFTVPGSPSFVAQGAKTAADTYNIGASLTLLSCACSEETWSLEAGYDYDWRNDQFSAHRGMVKLTSRF